MCAGMGAEMPELNYSTQVSSNEACSIMWLATNH